MTNRASRSALLLCLAAACLPAAGGASGAEPPPYRFDEPGPHAAVTKDLSVELLVLNESASAVELTLVVDGPMELGETADEAEPRPALEPRPAALALDPGGHGRVVVEPDGPGAPAPGRYLVAMYAPGGPVVRTELQLQDPPGEARELPTPRFETWTMRPTRWLPGWLSGPLSNWLPDAPSHWAGSDSYLPVDETCARGRDEEPTVLGYLSSGGSSARVSWTGEVKELASGLSGAKLSVHGLGDPSGTYRGKLELAPEVALEVYARDFFVWPLLALTLGLWIAHLAEHVIKTRRPIWRARARKEQLALDFAVAKEQFERLTADKPWAHYDISDDFEALRRGVTDKLEEVLGEGAAKAQGHASFAAAVETLERLEAAAVAWPKFAGELQALAAARDRLDERAPQPPPGGTEVPALRSRAEELLHPSRGALTLEVFEQRRKDVVAAEANLRSWMRLEERVRIQRGLADELERRGARTDELEQARKSLQAAWGKLWRAADAASLEVAGVELEASRGLLDRVSVPRPGRRASLEEADTAYAQRRGVQVPGVEAAPSVEEVRRRRDYYLALHTGSGRVLFALAFALAVFSGLSQLYVGKAFGSLWDYLNAVAWGAGTKLTLDAVVAGLGRLPFLSSLSQRLEGPASRGG